MRIHLGIIAVAIFVVMIGGLLIGLVAYTRRKILRKLYQPTTTIVAWSGMEHLRDIYISTHSAHWSYDRPVFDGDNINVWYGNWFAHRPCVLYFHGNSYNISYREYMAKLCSMMHLNLLLVDYRGYGRSEGHPTSSGVLRDAAVAMTFLLTQRRVEDIIVWGESLGGSPACYIASLYANIRGLVLLSTFTSLHSLLRGPTSPMTRMIYSVARYATRDIDIKTNNADMLRKCAASVLIIHSKDDKLIPYSNAEELYLRPVHGRVKLIPIGGDHDSPRFTRDSIRGLLNFVNSDFIDIDPIITFVNSLGIDRISIDESDAFIDNEEL